MSEFGKDKPKPVSDLRSFIGLLLFCFMALMGLGFAVATVYYTTHLFTDSWPDRGWDLLGAIGSAIICMASSFGAKKVFLSPKF